MSRHHFISPSAIANFFVLYCLFCHLWLILFLPPKIAVSFFFFDIMALGDTFSLHNIDRLASEVVSRLCSAGSTISHNSAPFIIRVASKDLPYCCDATSLILIIHASFGHTTNKVTCFLVIFCLVLIIL